VIETEVLKELNFFQLLKEILERGFWKF